MGNHQENIDWENFISCW